MNEVSNEIDFLHADNRQTFQQLDNIAFVDHSQACPKHPK